MCPHCTLYYGSVQDTCRHKATSWRATGFSKDFTYDQLKQWLEAGNWTDVSFPQPRRLARMHIDGVLVERAQFAVKAKGPSGPNELHSSFVRDARGNVYSVEVTPYQRNPNRKDGNAPVALKDGGFVPSKPVVVEPSGAAAEDAPRSTATREAPRRRSTLAMTNGAPLMTASRPE